MIGHDQAGAAADLTEPAGLQAALERSRPFSMAGNASLVSLAYQVAYVLRWGIPGHFVECGVWRGGASFLMADLLRTAGTRDRKVWLFDSFAGLPAPEGIDGPRAFEYTRETDSPAYFDNCTATYDDVERNAAALGLAPYTEMVEGWFEQTLPSARERIGQIALLRIDCDWYSSTRCVLDNLYQLVSEGGFVVLDDYYAYEGSTLAVHEFLAKHKLPHRLESVVSFRRGYAHSESAYFRKVTDASTVQRRPLAPPGRVELHRPPGHTPKD